MFPTLEFRVDGTGSGPPVGRRQPKRLLELRLLERGHIAANDHVVAFGDGSGRVRNIAGITTSATVRYRRQSWCRLAA